MKKDMIWAYFIMLSDHFADDALGESRGLYIPPRYTEENLIDLDVWDDTIRFLGEHQFNTVVVDVGDQVILDSHPEIAAPNAYTKEFVKQKLDEIRALGMKPIPKLNFSACHHVWLRQYNRMVGTELYYKVCADIIAEVAELFDHPELFHLGLDEENYDCQYRWNEKVLIRGPKLWWHDLFFYFNEVEKAGARPWVWSDYFWHHPDLFLQNMPKSVLQSNWYYSVWKDYSHVASTGVLPDSGYISRGDENKVVQDAYEKLDRAGYDQVPTGSTFSSMRNLYQTMVHCKTHLSEEHLKGFMTASWFDTIDANKYILLNDAYHFYNARKDVYPESL